MGYTFFLLLILALYLFENNAGTRILLIATLLIPLIPPLARLIFRRESKRRMESLPRVRPQFRTQEEPCDIRTFVPGDPVNRIHWKLSAKRGQLLLRSSFTDASESQTVPCPDPVPGSALPAPDRTRRKVRFLLILLLFLLLFLLFLLPAARQGCLSICNDLFRLSEASNTYRYAFFQVSPDASPILSVFLLIASGLVLLALLFLTGSHLLALAVISLLDMGQIYLGLSLPAWIQIPLHFLLLLFLCRPFRLKIFLPLSAAVILLSLTVLLLLPGVDPALEEFSERIRDRLTPGVTAVSSSGSSLSETEKETRHTHFMTREEGNSASREGQDYREVTRKQSEISRPDWMHILEIILRILLIPVLLLVPFLPFLLSVVYHRKREALRERYLSEDLHTALCAIFQSVTVWLEEAGIGSGNLPYVRWSPALTGLFSPDYIRRFQSLSEAFEEAAYSEHSLREETRKDMLTLLEETGKVLKGKCSFRARFRLKYREGVWI